MRSLAYTPFGNSPLTTTCQTGGTRSHVLPSAMATPTSVEPMPVVNAPRAPPVHEWESAPTASSPGLM